MNRIFLASILFLALILPCQSQMLQSVVTGKTVPCTVANDSALYEPVDTDFTDGSSRTWVANKVVFASQVTVTLYKSYACDNGSDAGTIDMLLMSHDAGNDYPDETSEVADSTKSLAASALTDCASYVSDEFVLATPLVVAAGTYWVVNKEVGSNTLKGYDSISTGDRMCYSDNSGTDWTCYDNQGFNLEVWGCN